MEKGQCIIGHKYKVIGKVDEPYCQTGDVITFEKDDGSDWPWFTSDRALAAGYNTFACGLSKIEPYKDSMVGKYIKWIKRPSAWGNDYFNHNNVDKITRWDDQGYKLEEFRTCDNSKLIEGNLWQWNDGKFRIFDTQQEATMWVEEGTPKILMSDGIEPKEGMWVHNIETNNIYLLTGNRDKDGNWLFNENCAIGGGCSAVIGEKDTYWRKATNLEVARFIQKHNLWDKIQDKLDFLVGLYMATTNGFAATPDDTYLIDKVERDHVHFGNICWCTPTAHPMHELVFTDVSEPQLITDPERSTAKYSVGDEVYDEEGDHFDSDLLLSIVDREYGDGWEYYCTDIDDDDTGGWIPEEDLRLYTKPTSMPDWVFPGVIFREKIAHKAIRTVLSVDTDNFLSTSFNGTREVDVTTSWYRSEWNDFEPVPYAEAQARWIERNNIKVGDTIKVVRQCENYFCGWHAIWVLDSMKIGIVSKVEGIKDNFGIQVNNFNYPYFCLKKVEATKAGASLLEQIQSVEDLFKELKEAYKRGEKIQYWSNALNHWEDTVPTWIPSYKYRIKPKKDPYQVFRDAIAQGKTVQYQGKKGDDASWITGCGWMFDRDPSRYRIKEDKPERLVIDTHFKLGSGAPTTLRHINYITDYPPTPGQCSKDPLTIQDLLAVTPERVNFELKITKDRIINL